MSKDKVDRLYEVIDNNNLDSEQVALLFLNYHGTQLITEEFFEFIEGEGYYVE